MLNEVVAKQAVILGPDIAILKARSVPSIHVSDDGKIIDVDGDPSAAVQELIDSYVSLSGQIVKSAMTSIFSKYPSMGATQS